MTEQSRQSQDAEAQDADEHDDWTYAARNPSRDVDLNLQPIREDFPTLRQRGVGLDQEPGIASTVQEPSTGDDQTSDHHVKFVNEFNSGHCSNPFLSPRQNHSPTATSKHNQWLDRPTKNLQRAHTNPQSSPPNQRHQVSSQYRSASFPAQNPAYQDTGSTFQYTEPRYLDPPFSQLGFSNVQKGNLNAQHTGYPQHRSPYESLHHNDSFRIPGLNEFGSDSSNLFPPSPLPGMTGQPFGAVPQFTGNAGLLHPQSGLQEIYSPGHYPGWSPVAIHDPLSQAVNQPIYSPLGHPFSPLPQQTSSHQLQDQADPSYSSFQRILPPASPTDEQVHHNSCQQLDCEKGKPKCKKGKPNNFAQNPKYGPWSNKFSTWNQARAVIKETNWITPTGDHTIPRTDEEKLEWVRRLFAAIMDGRHVHDKWHANAKNNKLLKADLEQDDVEVGCWKAVQCAFKLHTRGATLDRSSDPTCDSGQKPSWFADKTKGEKKPRKEAHKYTFAQRMERIMHWACCEKAFATDLIGLNTAPCVYDPDKRGKSKGSNLKGNEKKGEDMALAKQIAQQNKRRQKTGQNNEGEDGGDEKGEEGAKVDEGIPDMEDDEAQLAESSTLGRRRRRGQGSRTRRRTSRATPAGHDDDDAEVEDEPETASEHFEWRHNLKDDDREGGGPPTKRMRFE